LATTAAIASAPTVAEPASQAAAQPPALSVDAVQAAASAIRADPDLGGFKTERIWRFKDRSRNEDPAPKHPFWASLALWLAEGGRGLVWLLGAVALAVAVVAARRWLAVHGEPIG